MGDVASQLDWRSPERQTFIREVITQAIPQWPAGPRDFQVVSCANTLQCIPQLNIIPCAGGKTAHVGGRPAPSRPIILGIGPLKELQNSQVSAPSPQR
ncbi:hypothetical protein OF83DRAFT_1152501 [Amylostereum chailletii]|nr:hypothetical protein OF83DRAFT_1152501 [Amylostereum chailletii]